MTTAQSFEGKSVIITGASAGVGAEVARVFAEQGARLMLVARGKEALREIATELGEQTKVETMALDVSNSDGCRDLIKKTVFEFGCVHYLINNAGAHHRGNFDLLDVDEIAQMVDVNLRAPLILSRIALEAIRESGGGGIVNVG